MVVSLQRKKIIFKNRKQIPIIHELHKIRQNETYKS